MINFFKRRIHSDSTAGSASEGDQLALVSGFVALGAGCILLASTAEVSSRPVPARPEHVLLEGTAWLPTE
jgi:hypothetical protein